MFLLFLVSISCLTEILSSKNSYRTSSFVIAKKNTVLLIETKPNTEFHSGGSDKALKQLSTTIKIKSMNEDKPDTTYYVDTKKTLTNTYFFTTPEKGKFLIEIYISPRPSVDKIAFNWDVFVGKESVPEIVSNNDVMVERAEAKIKSLISYVKDKIMIQRLGSDDELGFKKLYDRIIYKAIFIIVLKIVATVITLIFSSFKTKQFYSMQYNNKA